jgi:hypothetical protein
MVPVLLLVDLTAVCAHVERALALI